MSQAQNTPATRIEFKAIVKGTPSQTFEKENGGQYVLQNCEITEGPLKGKIVSGTRTIKNAKGDEKEVVEVNTEVKLYLTRVESTTQQGGFMNFFEISTGLSASQDELNDLLNASQGVNTANVIASQAV